MMKLSLEGKKSKNTKTFGFHFLNILVKKESRTYSKAMSYLKASFWKETINNEIKSIINNHILELLNLPIGSKPLDYKWIFKRKMKVNGTIDK
jgi:hypothetical protein